MKEIFCTGNFCSLQLLYISLPLIFRTLKIITFDFVQKMKKYFFTSILFLALVVTVVGQNQLSFETNAYLSGDKHGYSLVKNLSEVNEGPSGMDVIWDFTSLEGGDSLTSYLLDATQLEGGQFFPETNIVIRENKIDYYCKVSPNGMEEYGYMMFNVAIKYDVPIVRFSFPFEFGEKVEGAFSGRKVDSMGIKVSGIYQSEIDAYGTLILPGNEVYRNVVRVRTVQKRDNISSNQGSYRWYLKNTDPVLRYPLLSIAKIESETNSFVRRAGYHLYYPPLAEKVGTISEGDVLHEFISPEAQLFKLKVYPNPFIEKVTVDYELPEDAKITIVVSDTLGRKVETLIDEYQQAGVYTAEFKENKGYFVYFVSTYINGKMVNSKKLIHVKK